MSRFLLSRFVVLTIAVLVPGAVWGMEARVAEVRTIGPTVRASVDLRDMLPVKLRSVLEAGGSLHVRVQAELWEDRPVWDRLVRPAIVSVFRIVRDPGTSNIAVLDALGQVTSYPVFPDPLSLRVDVVPVDLIAETSRYYLRLIATIGTIAQKDIDDTGAAVFGQDDSAVSLGTVGKLIFNTVLQVTDYLQSVSAEARSRRFDGRELKAGIR